MTSPTSPAAPAPRDPAGITEYHAHIYYDPAATRPQAEAIRAELAERFPDARLGRWHDTLVGPHTRSMFQVAFAAAQLPAILPWLLLNRRGLAVLLHPETGNAYADHAHHAAWLGEVLPLRLDALPGER
ncbi:DOPA 4,5-dioxygenase family protein [Roseomonas sp. BN140053]|uniref:DOPA 4,5-dioxygenase family protein n=1 Tax=Roseomonas sp. BN140053 TaxID=3391898 RepID=UPI0039EBCE7F